MMGRAPASRLLSDEGDITQDGEAIVRSDFDCDMLKYSRQSPVPLKAQSL